jgi:hypothetical protein
LVWLKMAMMYNLKINIVEKLLSYESHPEQKWLHSVNSAT